MQDLEELSQLRNAMEAAYSDAALRHPPGERAMIALVKMARLNWPTFENGDLRNILLKHGLCSEASLTKETSNAKSDLLEAEFIQLGKKASIFRVTDAGRDAAAYFLSDVKSFLDKCNFQERLGRLSRGQSGSAEIAQGISVPIPDTYPRIPPKNANPSSDVAESQLDKKA